MSLVTAAFGAGLNVILNVLMIPSMGAQGAGIATAISYFAVFAFRTIHSKSFMPFDLKAVKILANTMIVVLQIILMLSAFSYNILVQVILIASICAINAKSIISALKKVLKKFIKN